MAFNDIFNKPYQSNISTNMPYACCPPCGSYGTCSTCSFASLCNIMPSMSTFRYTNIPIANIVTTHITSEHTNDIRTYYHQF